MPIERLWLEIMLKNLLSSPWALAHDNELSSGEHDKIFKDLWKYKLKIFLPFLGYMTTN